MLIREVEQRTGIKDVNIRYYEKEGLIHPKRKSNGYREYSEEDVERIQKIKVLRLLDIPVPVIKEVLDQKMTLQDAASQRLSKIKEEENKIKEIRISCETIIHGNIQVQELNEEILSGTTSTWKERLDELMREDIDRKFLRNGFFYLIGWAVFAKLALMVLGVNGYLACGVGIFFLLYAIGLNIFEELTDKAFFWVTGTNWSGGGLGALGNSYTFAGIGVAFIGENVIVFLAMLFITCILISLIRGRIMYLKSPKRKKELPKTGKAMFLVSLLLFGIFSVSVIGLFADYRSQNPPIEQKAESAQDGTVLTITANNWEEYFTLIEVERYEKDENGKVIRVYLEAWFELKDEYWEKLDLDAENKVVFNYRMKEELKKYQITDATTGAYEILGDAPKGILQPENVIHQTWWNAEENGCVEDTPMISKYTGEQDYIYCYDDIEVKGVEGTIVLK